MISVADFSAAAAAWLDENARRRPPATEVSWGQGSDTVAVFHNLSRDEERAHVDALRDWQRHKSDAGYGSIAWPVEHGGAGLTTAHEREFTRLERQFVTPAPHEAVTISLGISTPTILTLGTDEQKLAHLRGLRRCDLMCCQLFSEPGAGSDLGSISMSAVRDGDSWVLNGQKVWTSGAQFADLGWLVARTDSAVPRQRAMTAFLVDMRTPGIEVRPLRQMTGGSSFNEVFFSDVHVPDTTRVGEIGTGWQAMMTTLGFERAAGGGGAGGNDMVRRVTLLARHVGRDTDPVIRQRIAAVHTSARLRGLNAARAAETRRATGVPGPEGSIVKLAYSNWLQEVAALVSELLGPRLTADTGEWGTYAWAELVCGYPGMRLGGGSDEIQRNTIAERTLGLPRDRT